MEREAYLGVHNAPSCHIERQREILHFGRIRRNISRLSLGGPAFLTARTAYDNYLLEAHSIPRYLYRVNYTLRELMVAAAAREIRDGDKVFVGMRLPLLGFAVAKEIHAPGAIGVFENGVIRDWPALESIFTMSDPPNIAHALACGSLNDVMYLLQTRRIDLGFIGGAEIDRFGNLNTHWVDESGKRVRLPGSGGAADIATMAKRCIIIMNHEKRRFTAKVRFITSPGFGDGGNWRERRNLIGGGPSRVITSMGIFSFDPASHEMTLSSHHPGITVEQIAIETGWPLRLADDVHETSPPTDEELAAVRKYDPQGVWTG